MSIRVITEPTIYFVGEQSVLTDELDRFLCNHDASEWTSDAPSAGEELVETAGRLCFDDQTEVLTPWGWKLFRDVCEDSPVATLNPDTKAFEFQLVDSYHCYDFDGDLLRYDGRDVSFAVTPEHRQYAARKKKIGFGEFGFSRTDDLMNSFSFKVLTAPESWTGSIPEIIEEPSVWYKQRISNQAVSNVSVVERASKPFTVHGSGSVLALASLCAHYVANGSIHDQEGSGHGIVIYGREKDEIQKLCRILNLPSSVYVDPRNGCSRVIIGGGQTLASYFQRACGRGCQNKKLPGWMLNLPREELEIIWDILVRTDGHTYESGRSVFLTGSKTVSDQAQEILAKLGYSSYVTTVRGTNSDCYSVSKKRGLPAIVRSARVCLLPYKGKVYCVTTKNGIVYVRRSGKVHFSGNCYMSFRKPRPGGNAAYTKHILEVGHGSVLEHAVFNFILTGVSRSFTHELVRHRVGFSYSQLSQRFVDESDVAFVVPPALASEVRDALKWEDGHSEGCSGFDEGKRVSAGLNWIWAARDSKIRYVALCDYLFRSMDRKPAREAARSVLPNCTETKIFVTANARALRHFIELRASEGADAEIRRVAILLHAELTKRAPNLFGDYRADGVALTTDHRKV